MRARLRALWLLRILSVTPVSVLSVLVALPQHPDDSAPSFMFHHLHLRDTPPAFLIEFYERLFDRAVTRRVTFAGVPGLQMGSRLILVSPATPAKELPAALWHFGWGQATLGESYLAHARREVAWEPPLPPEELHIHLRSVRPSHAATWYRDVLGAFIEMPPVPPRSDVPLPPPEHRLPEALVHFGGMALLVYRTEPPLLSSVGQQIDHVAFSCDDLPAALAYLKAKNVVPSTGPIEINGVNTAMIVGPDQIAIELVETTR
jgi:hypothetical protein